MPADDRYTRPGVDVVSGTTVPAPGAMTDTALAGVPVPPAPGSGAVLSDAALRRALHGLPGVDQTGAHARAAALATRSIKREAKLWALDMAVRMVDLTTLEGADTPGKIRGLCAKARQPDPADPALSPGAQGRARRAPPPGPCRRSPRCACTRSWSRWRGPAWPAVRSRWPRWPPR